MAKESELGADEMADDVKQLKAERDAAKAEAKEWKQKYEDVKSAHDQLHVAHKEVLDKTGYKIQKPYEYKADECRPVSLGGECPVCGWKRDTQMRPNDKQKEPHPID